MFVGKVARRFGNKLYESGLPIYRPLYCVFGKMYADRAERQILAQHLSAGCVVVDAGANSGFIRNFFRDASDQLARCTVSKPTPENFRHLSAAVAGLQYPRERTRRQRQNGKIAALRFQ